MSSVTRDVCLPITNTIDHRERREKEEEKEEKFKKNGFKGNKQKKGQNNLEKI